MSGKTNKKNEKVKKQKSSAKSSKVVKYFKDLKSEFNKVVWPSKRQVFNNTLVVLVSVSILGLFIFGLDTGFLKILELVSN